MLELKRMVHLQKNISDTLAQRIIYWNAGPPNYRWRDVLNQLNVDDSLGTSGVVMLLFHTAVYDATVAAWDTKYAYNRLRPFQFQPQIKPKLYKPDSPSYPCEFSVAAGVATQVIAHFFPEKEDSVRQLAEEMMSSRIAAGVQYPSDTKAGFALGQQVAQAVLSKANSFLPRQTWDGVAPAMAGAWKGAKPIGANWGRRKPFLLDSASQFRPGPPPDYTKEMEELKSFKQSFRSMANAFYHAAQSFWAPLLDKKILEYNIHLNPPRAARIYALRAIAHYDAQTACWEAKYHYWATRPDQYDTTFKPILLSTPPFPGYPSGHAAFAGASATMLSYFFPAEKEYFFKMAAEACESRFEAGVHFRTDNVVGMEMGEKIAALVIQKAKMDGADSKQVRPVVKRKVAP